MFDTILLLGEGGCPIYFGPSSEASSWLQSVLINRYVSKGDRTSGMGRGRQCNKAIPQKLGQTGL